MPSKKPTRIGMPKRSKRPPAPEPASTTDPLAQLSEDELAQVGDQVRQMLGQMVALSGGAEVTIVPLRLYVEHDSLEWLRSAKADADPYRRQLADEAEAVLKHSVPYVLAHMQHTSEKVALGVEHTVRMVLAEEGEMADHHPFLLHLMNQSIIGLSPLCPHAEAFVKDRPVRECLVWAERMTWTYGPGWTCTRVAPEDQYAWEVRALGRF